MLHSELVLNREMLVAGGLRAPRFAFLPLGLDLAHAACRRRFCWRCACGFADFAAPRIRRAPHERTRCQERA